MSKFDVGTGYKSHMDVCSSFRIVFVPTPLALLPHGVMLHVHHSTAMNLDIVPPIF